MSARTIVLAGVLAATITIPAIGQSARLDPRIVTDLLSGFGGDVTALKRGLDASAERLEESPNDAEVLAWHGAAMLSWSRLGNAGYGFAELVERFQTATGEMDRAVTLEPDNPRVRMARGILLQIETPGTPRFPNHPGLVENARADYQRLFDLRKDGINALGTHRLGELLQGLGDLYSRQGKAAEAEAYYRMIQSKLPDSEYAKRAAAWLIAKQPLATPQTTCIGCHETR